VGSPVDLAIEGEKDADILSLSRELPGEGEADVGEPSGLDEGGDLGHEIRDRERRHGSGVYIIPPMSNVVFVAPFFMETTLRFVDAAASLPGVNVGLVSQDPEAKLPRALAAKLVGHYRVEDGVDVDALRPGLLAMRKAFGSIDRILGTLEQLQVPLGVLRDELGVVGVGAETAHNFRDKARMKTVLAQAGLPCARHRLAFHPEDVFAFVSEVGYPVVMKPPAGAGAQATFRVDDERVLAECLRSTPPSRNTPVLVEEFVTGEEHSFDSVVLGGRIVWYSVNDYSPAPIEVLRQPWIQWCVLSPRDVDAPRYHRIREAAGPALRALGLENGLSHMEWFRRPDGAIAISEVGARPPGAQFVTLISYAHDFDLYRAWARLMVHDRFDPPERKYAVGAAYLRAQGRGGTIQTIHGLAEAQSEIGDLVVEAKLPKPGQSPSGTYEGDGFVILRHPETEVVERALKRLIEKVHVELG
jgi:D-alanine-D-alanine ligase-like ATP-grasp enzyme